MTDKDNGWTLAEPLEIHADVRELAYLQSIREEIAEGHVHGERREHLANYVRRQIAFQGQVQASAEESVQSRRTIGGDLFKSIRAGRKLLEDVRRGVAEAEAKQRNNRTAIRVHRAEARRAAQIVEAYRATLAALETSERGGDAD